MLRHTLGVEVLSGRISVCLQTGTLSGVLSAFSQPPLNVLVCTESGKEYKNNTSVLQRAMGCCSVCVCLFVSVSVSVSSVSVSVWRMHI